MTRLDKPESTRQQDLPGLPVAIASNSPRHASRCTIR